MSSKYNKFPRGSEWRRWDLHIHTPETNKNDQFEGSSPDEKWNNYINVINGYEEAISVIGVTDYFSTKNYFKFKQLIAEEQIIKTFDLVIPNVELRISPVTGSSTPINIHCLFNPSIDGELNDRFFAKLKFNFSGSDYSATESELIRLGKAYSGDIRLTSSQAYKTGVNQYVIEFGVLQDIFSKDQNLRDNTIVIVSNSSNDGASGLNHSDLFVGTTSQLDATRRSIYQFTDAIFSANPKDRSYFVGEGPDNKETVITKCGSLKPCFHGCDAHVNDKVFNPDENRFCWVKADPTFEGLKQVLYEPQDRVHIGESHPDEKVLYQVIESVKFEDTHFQTSEIQINSNFTAIIGGKSTGKSLLLRSIAKTIDPEEYKRRLEGSGLVNQKGVEGMIVKWKDGQINSLGSTTDVEKRIIYIPQSYLNRIVDVEKSNTDIDNIIKDILLQDSQFKEWYDTLKLTERQMVSNIDILISSMFEALSSFYSSSSDLKKIGDEKGIKQQIIKINDEIKGIQAKLKLTPEEVALFEQKIEIIAKMKLKIDNYIKDLAVLKNISEIKVSLYNRFDYELKSDEYEKKLQIITTAKEAEYSEDWRNEVVKLAQAYKDEIQDVKENLLKEEKGITELRVKIESQKSIQEKYNALKEEKEKEQKLEEYKKTIEEQKRIVLLRIDEIVELAGDFFTIYLEAKDKINKEGFDDELKFDIETLFYKQRFQENFERPFFDGRSLRSEEYHYITDLSFTTKEEYKSQLKYILKQILNDKLPLKEGFSKKEVVSGLIKNWFYHKFKVEYYGDQLNEMSPGKKSFVLLRLLIDLDNSKCPILIDQPEDDLDNRSIYFEVVKFLRNKKSERQIIIATHNPNLVLGADSEQIIVANQEGKDSKNKSSKFEYVSGSIEHSFKNDLIQETLYRQGIQEHICDILEGGEEAFIKRKNKYHFKD
ncbi:MAG TPA: hypothetical protein VL021_08450 [Brumimicrobium sp.]|nr:hypothetical protein [Brumimicrobium sp.]